MSTFKEIVESYATPLIKTIRDSLDKRMESYKNKNLILQGGVVGNGTILKDGDTAPVTITTTVVPTMHKHSKEQLPVTVPASPNTIALRDNAGNTYSNDASTSNTGYKLANGTDLAALFAGVSDTYVSINYTTTGKGGACTDASISLSGNRITLTTSWAEYCSFWAWCRCRCCC